jgi:hypothetical protein
MATKKTSWEQWKRLEDRAQDGAWARASAYLVFTKAGELVARIRFAYPRDGAGKLQAFAVTMADLDMDNPMASRHYGWANGGGYDKATAAMTGYRLGGFTIKDEGYGWQRQIEDAGYIVHWAI